MILGLHYLAELGNRIKNSTACRGLVYDRNDLHILSFHLCLSNGSGESLRVGSCESQVVLRILVSVHSYGKHIGGGLSVQASISCDNYFSITTFYIVGVKSIVH